MGFKIGTRIKKVAGYETGATGVVVEGPCSDGRTIEEMQAFLLMAMKHPSSEVRTAAQSARNTFLDDMYVRSDQSFKNHAGRDFPAGTIATANSSQWVPIVPDGHQPCEESFNLDDLIGATDEQRETARQGSG